MTKLGVNIDHVATIREARRAIEPDPVSAAFLAEHAGAHGITVHLRGDRRHIKDRDVRLLRETVQTRLNVEMAVTSEMVALIRDIQPDTVTLVPESPDEITTEGGLDLLKQPNELARTIRELRETGIGVSLFIDPLPAQLEAATEVGAALVELNTAAYSRAVPKGLKEWDPLFEDELERLTEAAEEGASRGLRILAGHGLTYRNVFPVSSIPEIEELNIGHNIIARATLVGLERAVRDMISAMRGEFLDD
jgi:pyridoxine 5-phosphate synthase